MPREICILHNNTMDISKAIYLTDRQKQDITLLWNTEYPAHLAYENVSGFENYLAGLSNPTHLTISDQEGCTKAWLIIFTREEARWFAMILDSSLQGKGIGTQLLDEAKKLETELNGWATDHTRDIRADGTAYPSPIGFYQKNGFEILSGTRLEKGALSTVKIRWRKN